jgi:ADP-heptose:LPS heptosyltransferase
MRIILSRTDSIGDVVLTLPVAAALKQEIPDCKVVFLVREYTRPIVELCKWVDEIVVWPPVASPTPSPTLPLEGEGEVLIKPLPGTYEGISAAGFLKKLKADVIIHVFPVKEICVAAKRAEIPIRIATARRFFTLFTCNRLLHIPRKNSNLHESQLNLKMLKGLGIKHEYGLDEIAGMYGLESGQVDGWTRGHMDKWTGGQVDGWTNGASPVLRTSIILHPKSKGSAREWGLDNFSRLIDLLPQDKFDIMVTGTKEEGGMMRDFLEKHRGRIIDLTGKLSLSEFIDLIGSCDALVAASTGPLHIAAALGIRAIGLYAPMRPIFPKRWAPVGKNATYLVLDKSCSDCRKTGDCHCIRSIRAEEVAGKLLKE